MASPFSIFRKNQRVWMAGAVFIAIVAFVISPMLGHFTEKSRNGRTGNDVVIASWNGGLIRRGQLEREYEHLRGANVFLRKLASDVMKKGGMPSVPGFNADLSELGIAGEMTSPDQIVQRKLLVAEAKRMGIVFDENSVKKFLELFTDGKISGSEIQKTLVTSTDGRLSWFDFTNLMQEELAKNEVLAIAGSGLRFENRRESRILARPALTSPGKNWQDFLKFNRLASIQAYPIFVKDFESKVSGKPSEREIQEIYKAGKELLRNSRTPATQAAFVRPASANFEYLSIDLDQLTTEQMKLIPEDTLRAEYDRKVKEKQLEVPVTPTEEDKKVEPPPATTDAAPSNPETPAATPEQPAAPEASKEESPVPPVLEEPKNNAFLPAANSTVKLVSYQEPATQEPATQEPAKPAEPVTQEPATAESTTKPVTPPASDEKQGNEVPPPAVSVSEEPVANSQVVEPPKMRTKTFEEAREQIARDLAQGTAFQLIRERITNIQNAMGEYQNALRLYQTAKNENAPDAVIPEKLDLEKLGKEQGFVYGITGKINADTVQQSPIGSTFVMRGDRQQIPFGSLISDNSMPLYTPLTSMGFTGGFLQYVFWKTSEEQPYSPSLEVARPEIVEVWLQQQAFKLASEEAREIAQKAKGGSLKDSITSPDEKALVMEPTPFTWFNPMFARMESRMQLSNVEPLQPIDESFMEAVFNCAPGETTVASDMSKKICYVVQVTQLAPDNDKLLEKFSSAPLEGVSTVSRNESDRAIQFWFQNLQKQLGFRASE